MDNLTNKFLRSVPKKYKENKKEPYKPKRFFEIDIIKGISVILMVIFHFFYLSHYMDVSYYNVSSGILSWMAKSAHYIFIFIVGVNLAIINQKYKKMYKEKYEHFEFSRQLKRALFLVGGGIIMTILSYLGFGENYIKFGILHFVGVSIILSQFFVSSRIMALIIAIFVLILNFIFNSGKYSSYLYDKCQEFPFSCFIGGVKNLRYNSLDHFSMVPFFALLCIGIVFGHTFYKDGNKRIFLDKEIDNAEKILSYNPFSNMLSYIGSKSLSIYFIHFIIFYIGFFIYKKHFIYRVNPFNSSDFSNLSNNNFN